MTRPLFLASVALLAACGSGPAADLWSGRGSPGLAIVNSDYMSTVISLADPTTSTLEHDDCLDSGSSSASLSMALSGNVALPSAPQPGGELVLIDRTNSALTWVDTRSCAVSLQLSVGTGFYANPHDVVGLSTSKAYVTRYKTNPNPSGTPGANDQGNDILIVDPSAKKVTGRIDLAPYASQVSGATILARPDRALLANGKVYVSLANLSSDYKFVGPGGLAVVDPSSDKVTGTVDLSPYTNCSSIDYIASTTTLVVACNGNYNLPTADQAAESALVLVDVSADPPVVLKAIGASATGGRPIAGSTLAVVGPSTALAVTYGESSGTPADALWAIALDTGTATSIVEADGSFVLWSVVWIPDRQQALVTDASATKPVVRVLDVSQPSAIRQVSTFEANPKSGLPPRMIGWY